MSQTGTSGPRTNHTKDTRQGVATVSSHENHQHHTGPTRATQEILTATVCRDSLSVLTLPVITVRSFLHESSTSASRPRDELPRPHGECLPAVRHICIETRARGEPASRYTLTGRLTRRLTERLTHRLTLEPDAR